MKFKLHRHMSSTLREQIAYSRDTCSSRAMRVFLLSPPSSGRELLLLRVLLISISDIDEAKAKSARGRAHLASRSVPTPRLPSRRAWKATLVSLAAPASAPPHPTTASHSEFELFKARVGLSQARAERNSTSRGVPARNAVFVSLSRERASPSSVSGVQPPCRRSEIPDAARDDVRGQEAHRDAALKRAATESRRWLALSQRCSRDLDRRSGSPRRSYRRRASLSYFPISRMLRGPDWLAAALDSALIRASPGPLFRRMKTPLLQSSVLSCRLLSLLPLSASPARTRERESER